ncbi:site-specific integrase [Saccharopolyspora sp. K220]|uniref:tyrosine-type recombinase/integrase n=1 Tax=Saccharopolyspora soli TaxID=2926618 RepID=UPI001F56611D|nr:tyrosine-type recombinase/integrase [Saccharopolyspora soli]MCI2421150.1 site-specific integrase [Saccharopolyspora soli]
MTPLGATRAPGLLERLMEVVRPEFRGEVFYPPRDSRVFVQGFCRIPSCGIALSFASRQLCQGHYQRWKAAGSPELKAWLAAEDIATQQRRTVATCAVRECNRSVKSQGLCNRHMSAWTRSGRPSLEGWVARTLYSRPRASAERDCEFPDCPLWTDGPGMPLCRSHYERWRYQGKITPLTDWFTLVENTRHPHVRLHDLSGQVRLEIQYGLQRRHALGSQHTAPRVVTKAVHWVRAAGVHSLLDWDDTEWKAFCRPKPANYDTLSLAFIKDTRFELHALMINADPWADQYPRDVWDLKHLGLNTSDVRHLRFGEITPPWLKDLVKRWCRWRLTRQINPSTVAIDLRGCTRLATYLATTLGQAAEPAALDRARIEAWLAVLQTEVPDPITRTAVIHSVGTFLKDAHRHDWQPDLPRNAFIYDDAPKRPSPKPRFIPEHIMRQMEAPTALAQFPSDDGRLIVEIVIACGLRLKDARTLPFECVVRDDDGHPYLAWLNRKMRDRPAFFPISEDLAAKIATQQQAVEERFSDGAPWLFPAIHSNIDGSKYASATRLQDQLELWLEQISLVDERGKPVRVTFHQFRHTLGTRLINSDVPQPVVQVLLDHMSPQMTAVYARLLDETKREHWLKAVKINAEGRPASIAADHPLADATWAKLSMVRAKVTLPNGYCGAPVQTDCEYANPCLDCKFFITTAEFLDQHRRQRNETSQMISDAENAGLRRVVEKNTRTLTKLTTIIDALESAEQGQIVVGGNVEDLDAAG